MTRNGTSLCVAVLLSGCYLSHQAPLIVDAPDAAPPPPLRDGGVVTRDSHIDIPACEPGEPCDCLVGGRVDWDDIGVCVLPERLSSTSLGGECSTVASTWGTPVRLRARCAGRYRFCARVVSFESGCEVTEVCTEGSVGVPGTGLRMPPPSGWSVNTGACAEETSGAGGMVCGRVEWTANDGEVGSREIGCLGFCGYFTPFCGAGACTEDCGHIGGDF